jgi:hypothetical protein
LERHKQGAAACTSNSLFAPFVVLFVFVESHKRDRCNLASVHPDSCRPHPKEVTFAAKEGDAVFDFSGIDFSGISLRFAPMLHARLNLLKQQLGILTINKIANHKFFQR